LTYAVDQKLVPEIVWTSFVKAELGLEHRTVLFPVIQLSKIQDVPSVVAGNSRGFGHFRKQNEMLTLPVSFKQSVRSC
jgi:hypothetical protein